MTRWKDIKGFEGRYAVSETGEVKRLACLDSMGRCRAEKILTEKRRWGRYKNVELWLNGSRFVFPIHRLVYEHFVGGMPKGHVIHHKDGNKGNNRPSNLESVTGLEHNRKQCGGRIAWNRGKKYGETAAWKSSFAARTATLEKRNGERNREILRLASSGSPVGDIAVAFGLCRRQVYTILKKAEAARC